jgi:hypothetical protein
MTALESRQRQLWLVRFTVPLLAVLLAETRVGLAEQIIFTVDNTQSTFDFTATLASFGGGPFIEQSPGSSSAPISGHFLVDFDSSTPTPSSLSFIDGHGYVRAESPHLALPGIGGSGTPALANLALKSTPPFDGILVAIRNLAWDFDSPSPISRTAGVYAGNQTRFTFLSGDLVSNAVGPADLTGNQEQFDDGNWTLSESNGQWSLSASVFWTDPDDDAQSTVTMNVVSTAAFGAANIAQVATGATQTEALGGSSMTGGVSAEFSAPTSGGTFTVQQIPNATGLSQLAVEAAEANPIFALSTASLSADPQIWNVNYTGTLNGTATLVFNYDPSLLPVGFDPLTLGIWHFSSLTNQWDFGGTVDPFAHTITYVADSFSPFMLGTVVPEPPSVILAAVAILSLMWPLGRRQVKRWAL